MAESSPKKTGRKHVEKGKIACQKQISPFPAVLSKVFYCRHVKTRACLGKS